MALSQDGQQGKMTITDQLRILHEVSLNRQPKTPDNEVMAAFRKQAQENAERLKAAGLDLHIPDDWPDPE